ncbi:TonB-dependent receptor [Flavipsychrobacter stenotrophus]|uniref:TonB-dependent receptor n=1 Tax=Flavipsychrobacter stenotrophus TaxID=2077091 RepID=A0A2S7SRG2_9BACT|nr:TonB-dependent receptor [Flavipsychrobacter stenotrophus]PQJ09334.1 TonB-dependent receptor [Flavipsychrobacter stenotrophus]
MFIKFRFLLLLILLPVLAIAQKASLSGYMRDSASGETLIGGSIYIKEANLGGQTNGYGFYSVSVPPGTYTVTFSYVGYQTQIRKIDLNTNHTYNAEMRSSTLMKEVEITTGRKNENVKNTEMGTVTLSIARIQKLPVLFGEVDVLKTIQLLPGVQSAGDGNAGFYVRGGGPDQNLVLLDDAAVYNTGHLFGFFSVFNSDAIKDVTLVKGGAPANYGGRLSSVVDVTMKEGNNKEFHGQGGIGLIASRFTLEGPLKKNKGSFMIAGRRTYIDVLLRPFTERLKNTGYYFYDLNLKANYRLGEKDRLYLSGYLGLDKFKFESENGTFKAKIPWGNTTASLRWNHQFSDKLFLNTTAVYNTYNFASSFEQGSGASANAAFGIKISSGVKDYNIKSDLDYYTSFNHHIKGGLVYTNHTFIPNQVSGQADTIKLQPNNALIKYVHEAGAYVLDDFDLTKRIKINVGLRYTWFGQVGPYTAYDVDTNGNKRDSTKYGKGDLAKVYDGLEPRFNIRYTINENSSVKGSVAKTYQYLHLVTNNGSTLPTDVWAPSTYIVKPQNAWQYSAGYFHNFLDNKLETAVEVYYKRMNNQVQYKDGYVPNSLQDPELSYVFGRGTAYGAELFINKTQGRFTGWVGYTLSWTYQKFALLNNGDEFPAKYDRRHDISVVASYEQSKKWTFSSVFIYGTGNAITLPTAFYFVGGTLVEQYSKTNSYRMPAYHRLDVSATYTPQHTKPHKWQGSWTFSVYNIYNHANPYFLYVDRSEVGNTGTIKLKVKEVYILPLLPSITYNFKF